MLQLRKEKMKMINSKNSKISDPHRLLLNISDKINLKEK